MKKIFLFAIAAVTMTVGCQKLQEIINPNNQQQIDDDSPVAIEFTTNVATVETRVRTKGVGVLDEFTPSHNLYIYGLNTTNGKEEIINAKANVTSATTAESNHKADLTFADSKTYYYSGTKDRYDFYGYYVDDAAGDAPTPSDDYKLDITINGSQDILLGKANPTADANSETSANPELIYSAWSARRSVKPNIVFDHTLAKYNFNIVNKGSDDVTLTQLGILSETKGVLTVAGKAQGLSMTKTTPALLELDLTKTPGHSDGISLTGQAAANPANPTPLTGSIMTFAGKSNPTPLVLRLTQEGLGSGYREISMPIEITPNNDTHPEDYTKPGYEYTIAIVIYSLESVKLEVTITPWQTGTTVNLDPDVEGNDEGYSDSVVRPDEALVATLTERNATSLVYSVTNPDDSRYVDIQLAVTTSADIPTNESDWKSDDDANVSATSYSVGTKASKNLNFTVTGLTVGTKYYCHLRYKTFTTGEEGTSTPSESYTTVQAKSSTQTFKIEKAYLVEDNETSYNRLPAWYREEYGEWSKYSEDKNAGDDDFNELPWLVVECTAAPNCDIKVTPPGSEAIVLDWPKTSGLVTISAKELGKTELSNGEYTVEINGATTKINVPTPAAE